MINLFQFASNDNSLQYLAQIFGYMNGVIPIPSSGSPSGVTPSGTSISLLGTMFLTFNSAILAVGTLVVLYTTIVGVIQTAYEGEFMGKKWNNIWIPIRTVLGIAALVPTGSGYSYIQIIMMWVIVQGIGAADTLWTTALNYVTLIGSPYATTTLPNVGTYQTINSLFSALVCDATARETNADPTGSPGGGYYCNINKTNDSNFCNGQPTTFNDDNNPSNCPANGGACTKSFSLGPSGSCGVLTYCDQGSAAPENSGNSRVCNQNSNSLACQSCQAQVQALQTVMPTLIGIAQSVEKADYQYRDFYTNSYNQVGNSEWTWIYNFCKANNISADACCYLDSSKILLLGGQQTACKAQVTGQGMTSPFPLPNALDASGNAQPQNPSDDAVNKLYWPYVITPAYSKTDFVAASVTEYMNQLTLVVSQFLASQNQGQSTLQGQLAQAQSQGWIMAGSYYYTIANMNSNNLASAIPTLSVVSQNPTGTSSALSQYRNNYSAAQTLMNAASGNAESSYAEIPGAGGFGSTVSSAGSSLTSAFSQSIQGQQGSNPLYALSIVGSVFLTVAEALFVTIIGLTLAIGLLGNLSVFGLGTGIINPVGGTLQIIYLLLIPIMFGLMGFLISIGGTLGIYVPLIPYVVFTVGAVGWLLSTVEAMVAGPLVALGILSPSGQHELLGKAEPALMLLFNIFLRPSLMIFGLMAAMLLATVVVTMINSAFYTVITGIGTGSAVLAWVLFLCAYVTLIVTALNKCFSAIYLIPEKVMRWISHTGESEGAGEALSAVKGGVEAGQAGGKGAADAGGAKAEKGAIGRRQQKQAQKGAFGAAPGSDETG